MPEDAGRWKKKKKNDSHFKLQGRNWSKYSFVSVRFHDFFKSKQEQETSQIQTQPLKHVDAAKVSGKQADIYTGLPPWTKFSDRFVWS